MFHAVSHFGLRALPHESPADSHFSPCFLFADALCLHLASTRKTSSSSANSDCRSPLSNLAATRIDKHFDMININLHLVPSSR